jgi:hypothetical protein
MLSAQSSALTLRVQSLEAALLGALDDLKVHFC